MVKVEIRACHHIVASILMFVDGISFEYGASPRELNVIKNKRAINIVEKGDGKIFWIASDGESFVDNGEFDGNILSESQSFVDYVKTFLMS